MIIFLYGEDSYRTQKKLNEIVEQYKKIHKSGLNFKQIDAKETKFQDFSDELKIASMFAEKKLIILKNVFSNQEFQEGFLRGAKDLIKSDDIIVVFEKDKIDARNKLLKFLEKETKAQESKPLDNSKLKNWIKDEFEKYDAKVDPKIIEVLTDYVGNDLWRMDNEIKKLVNYRKNGKVEVKDVELLVRPRVETDIFKTIDAIAQKNKKQALKLLTDHLEKGDSPLYLLSMINFQFRNLLIVKDLIEGQKPYNIILKKSGLHPFVVKKSYFQAQKFTLEELKKIYQKIFQVDLDIKTGKVKPELALEMLITQL